MSLFFQGGFIKLWENKLFCKGVEYNRTKRNMLEFMASIPKQPNRLQSVNGFYIILFLKLDVKIKRISHKQKKVFKYWN